MTRLATGPVWATGGLLLLVAACTRPPRAACPVAEPVIIPGGSGAADAEVTVEGAPEVPAALLARLRQALSVRSAELQDLFPDGGHALVTTRFSSVSQVHRVHGPGGRREQLTFGAEPVVDAVLTPDGSAVLLRRDTGGDERYQIERLDLASRTLTRLTEGRSRHGRPRLSPDGRWVAFTRVAPGARDPDLLVAPATGTGAPRVLRQGVGAQEPLEWSPDGREVLVLTRRSIHDADLHAVDVASGRATRLTPPTSRASVRLARFAAAGRTVLVATDREDEHATLLALDRTTGAWRPLTRGLAADVEGLAVAPDGQTAVVAVNVAGDSELHRIDLRTGERRRLPGLPRGVISGLRSARTAPVIAFTVDAATAPPDAYGYDLATERLIRFTHAERAGLPEPTLVWPRALEVPSFDGRRVPALEYRPRGPGPHPVLIGLHGGPEAQARPTWSALLQHLVTGYGIAVIQPNVRGSDGYGKTWLALDDGVRREGAIRDVGAVLDHVARQPDLDARRVAVLGGSYGGFLALAALATYGRRIRAGVDVVGISDLASFLGRTAAYRRDLRRAEYGDERDPGVRAALDRISPLRQAHRIRAALLVAQGANDPRVPRAESEQIVQAVRRAGGEVWYLLAHREGHGFRRQASRDQLHALTVLLLERHLLGTRSPVPGSGFRVPRSSSRR